MNNPKGLKKLREQYEAGKLPPQILQMFFAYAFGKPKEEIELTGNDGGPVAYRFVVARETDAPDSPADAARQ